MACVFNESTHLGLTGTIHLESMESSSANEVIDTPL